MKVKKIITISLSVSLIAEAFLIYIINYNQIKIPAPYAPSTMMIVNGSFNTLCALALGVAIYYIKQKNKKMHIVFIHLALLFSACFLINYILYHMSVGHVQFTNQSYRLVYLVILMGHLMASMIALPMILTTYLFGVNQLLVQHKKIAKWTFYLWEYVSVTGVLIVLMLKFINN